MEPRHLCVLMARYHRWAYQHLQEALEPVSDTDYRAKRNMQYGSIHRTLNHLLLADTLWYSRLTGGNFTARRLDDDLEFVRDKLFDRLIWQATTLAVFAKECDEATLAGRMHYTSLSGAKRSVPLAGALMHVFNHGTHHRCQVITVFPEVDQPAPALDLIGFLQDRQQKATEDIA